MKIHSVLFFESSLKTRFSSKSEKLSDQKQKCIKKQVFGDSRLLHFALVMKLEAKEVPLPGSLNTVFA